MKRFVKYLPARFHHAVTCGFCTLMMCLNFNISAKAFDFKAQSLIVYDYGSRSILVSKNSDAKIAPASMAKLMTLEVVFHAIKNGDLSLDQEYVVSEHAWRTGGAPSRTATMFAALKSSIRVEDLIRGVTVHTANDACIILAEGLAGSEESFADRMNERAAAIGLKDSHFTNPTGFVDPEMMTTTADLARLALHLLDTYPEFVRYFGELEFTWNKIRQFNKNVLVKEDIGVDGFMPGYDEESGFGEVVTAEREGQRILAVFSGLKSKKERRTEAKRMLDWAFRSFDPLVLFPEGEVLGEARVFGGDSAYVGLKGDGPVSILVPRGADERLRATIVYEGPVEAPVSAGQPIGHVHIFRDDILAQRTPLFADSDVGVGGLTRKAIDGASELIFGYW